MTNYIQYQESQTFTSADLGFKPFPDVESAYEYYEGVIQYAKDKFGFEPNEEHLFYPREMLEQPFIEFDDVDNPDIYADFVDVWNFLCYQCSPNVTFRFSDGGGLHLVNKEE